MEIKLSVVIITFNEEDNIGRCLESVKNVADEIIVVDSFSTDTTEAICKQFEVLFIKHKFEGHVEQKNFAINQAKGEYILSLDADEALSPELETSILNIKGSFSHAGYKFNRLTWYLGAWIKHSGWYPDTKLRLVKNGVAQWKGYNPHDRLELINKDEAKFLKGDLFHYSYKNLSDHVIRTDNYSSIAAEDAFKRKVRYNIVQHIFSPIFAFFKKYILQLGFLHGYNGFAIATMTAYGNFLKYAKLRELYSEKDY